MGVQGGVSGRASQIFALTEGNVLILGVLVALGQTEVDNINVVLRGLGRANQEVVWLDISVDYALLVHFLNALDLVKN